MLILFGIVPIFNTLRRLYFLTLRFNRFKAFVGPRKRAECVAGEEIHSVIFPSTLCVKGPEAIYTRRAEKEKR